MGTISNTEYETRFKNIEKQMKTEINTLIEAVK
jgi:hypothetical protein